MPLYVLKSIAPTGQTRFLSNFRNGRSRIIAFENKCDAKSAITMVKDAPLYTHTTMEVCETNTARLSSDVSGADIAVDFCDIALDDIHVARTIILRTRKHMHNDTHTVRTRLERDFAMPVDEAEDAEDAEVM